MKAKKKFRVRVMKYAHSLYEATENAWSICLLKAWELYRLAKKMRKGTVKFAFKKIDGTIRYAFGTLQHLPVGATNNGKKPTFKTFAYFDIERQAMRCFRVENLITVY
jgi:hypothetical protein